MLTYLHKALTGAALIGLSFWASGCGQSNQADPANGKARPVAHQGHDHSAWWCDEHGVPEAECSQCSSKVAAEFQKKGDWCEQHLRAKSQCFLCDPKAKTPYVAKYRLTEGKDPPPTVDEAKAASNAAKPAS